MNEILMDRFNRACEEAEESRRRSEMRTRRK